MYMYKKYVYISLICISFKKNIREKNIFQIKKTGLKVDMK